jgi:hypothetical protein
MNAVRTIAEVEGDREELSPLSLAGLARAYGDDEPPYAEQDLRERNPGYERR